MQFKYLIYLGISTKYILKLILYSRKIVRKILRPRNLGSSKHCGSLLVQYSVAFQLVLIYGDRICWGTMDHNLEGNDLRICIRSSSGTEGDIDIYLYIDIEVVLFFYCLLGYFKGLANTTYKFYIV